MPCSCPTPAHPPAAALLQRDCDPSRMCRRLVLRWAFSMWDCAHTTARAVGDRAERDDASDVQKSAVFYNAGRSADEAARQAKPPFCRSRRLQFPSRSCSPFLRQTILTLSVFYWVFGRSFMFTLFKKNCKKTTMIWRGPLLR